MYKKHTYSLVALAATMSLVGCSTVSMRGDDEVGTAKQRSGGFLGLGTAADIDVTYAKAF